MKKHLLKHLILVSVLFLGNSINAQCVGGRIKVDTMQCVNGKATLKLGGHTTASGTTYQWQRANSTTPYNFSTLAANSGKDTQDISSTLFGWYRCRITCPSGLAFSDTFFIAYQARTIRLFRIQCDTSISGNDSVILRALVVTPPKIDTNSVKSYRWEVTLAGASQWNVHSVTSSDSIKVKFTKNALDYRVKMSICPIYSSLTPTPNANQVTNSVRVGLDPSNISVTAKDCPNDTASISIDNLPLMKDSLKYRWYSASSLGGPYTIMASDSAPTVKVRPQFRQNKYYFATTRLCKTQSAVVDSTNIYALLVSQGNFTATYDCVQDQVLIDYQNRDSIRNSVTTTWYKSNNDSLNPAVFNLPVDSMKFYSVLVNKTNTYYKIYSKLCPNSNDILDSSNYVRVYLNVDSGQLKADTVACPNDSVYMQLLNYNGQASFAISELWEYKTKDMADWTDYTKAPMTPTTIAFRMPQGLTSYRKSVYFCPGNKYARKISSSVASTFLPYQLVYDSFKCDTAGTLTMRVLNDTVKVTDYQGTKLRKGEYSYLWIKSANKITGSVMTGQTGSTLQITNLDKSSFFRRIRRVCSSSILTIDSSNWSNYNFGKPNNTNGKAVVLDEICLNRYVTLGMINFTDRGETPFYVWQSSPDELVWSNLLTNDANQDTINVLVTTEYKYFRRLTFWCPSGIVDSSLSLPLNYNKPLSCEGFLNQITLGESKFYNCWSFQNACASWNPKYGTNQIWSRSGIGRTDNAMSHRGPPTADPPTMPTKQADGKLVSPAYDLKRDKIYRLSFYHKEDARNLCWDSLYLTWGRGFNACDLTNKFGDDTLTRFNFDQFAKFWADFIPPDDGIYYFAINYRDADFTGGNIIFDDICIKEVVSCLGKTPVKGAAFAPAKIIDRFEEPFQAVSYDKDKVTHQYCIWDTVMLTYNENNYTTNFDYYGMKYQFYRMRYDEDWKVNDYFFTPVQGNNTCHITNRSNYHVMNVLATDTNTYYKIVATCQFDGKEFHSDSLVINGTHSVPYCEDWEGLGNISNNNAAISALFPVNGVGNSGQIIGQVPSFSNCPTCWAAYPQPTPPAPNAADISMCGVTLPFRNTMGGAPLPPQLDPDQGWSGGNVVMTTDNRAMATTKNVLVFPAVRLYKGRGYRITVRWADNRKDLGAPLYGNDANRLDSLYLTWAKGNQMGKSMNNFTRANIVGPPELALKSNIKESGTPKYRTFWRDFSPTDTGTYYFAMAVVPGTTSMSAAYRFQMDYFCIDTITYDTSCNSKPTFSDPLVIRVSPDAKEWYPGDTAIAIPGIQWCVGTTINLELSTRNGSQNSWNYGWKYYWERNTINPITGNAPVWNVVSTTNSVSWTLRYKYERYRLRIANYCNTKDTIIGPFNIFAIGGDSIWIEEFEPPASLFPACWDAYTSPGVPWCRGRSTNYNSQHYDARCSEYSLLSDYETPVSSLTNCGAMPTTMTFVPPGVPVLPSITYRYSFWYRDNGISERWDSLRIGWSLVRPTAAWPPANTVPNKVNGDIVRNFREYKWRYYTGEVTPTLDTVYHFKISNHTTNNTKRLYRLLYDNFCFKPKFNNDALVIAIDSPEYQCGLTATTTVKVKVMNIGINTLSNIPIECSVNGGTAITATVPGPVLSNEVKTYYLSNVDLSNVGFNNVRVWTNIPSEQHRWDDTLCAQIINNYLPPAPTDTIDSICIYSNLRRTEVLPPSAPKIKWYKNLTDIEPFMIGDTFKIDSFGKDTCVYRSLWNGAVEYSRPFNTSAGVPQYVNAAAGLTFDNYSRDSLFMDSVTIYANSTGNGTVTISQFGVVLYTIPFNVNTLGKQGMAIKRKIPPGTDYKMIYTGTALLASLPTGAPYFYIFAFNGSAAVEFSINGAHNYPAAPAAYYYFFNIKLIKPGCETEKVKICFTPVSAPNFNLVDTFRVCSQPVFQICGPNAPTGDTYTYQWSPSGNTNVCDPATVTQVYALTVTNAFGCKVSDSLDLIVDPSPTFNLGNDTFFCRYTPYIIRTGLDSASNVVTWSDSKAGVNDTILNPGMYIATAYNTVNFCTGKDTINVARVELPIFTLGNDRVLCGESADLSTSLPSSGMSYQWGNNGGPVITKSQVNSSTGIGIFTVVGTDNTTKCKNVDTIVATLISYPNLDLGPDKNICGASDTIAPITPAPGKFYYVWNTTATTRKILVSTPGTYKLTIQDSVYGCISKDSVNVKFKQVPIFKFNPNVVVKCADALTLSAPIMSEPVNYSWTGPHPPYGNGASIVVDTSGVYCLTLSNNCYTYKDCVDYTLKKPAESAIDLLPTTDTGCQQVTLTVTSTPSKAQIRWGNPIPSSKATSNTLLIDKTGSYSVSLTNECGQATKSVFVKIDTAPKADFSVFYLPNCMSIGINNMSVNARKYEWDFGDAGKSSLDNPLHNYQADGEYIVTLKASNSCGFASKSTPIKKLYKNCDSFALSVTTNLQDANLYVFPNPTNSKATLYGIGLPNGQYSISVSNVLGQIIEKVDTKITSHKIEHQIDATKLANGEYTIIVTNDQETIARRLIVNK